MRLLCGARRVEKRARRQQRRVLRSSGSVSAGQRVHTVRTGACVRVRAPPRVHPPLTAAAAPRPCRAAPRPAPQPNRSGERESRVASPFAVRRRRRQASAAHAGAAGAAHRVVERVGGGPFVRAQRRERHQCQRPPAKQRRGGVRRAGGGRACRHACACRRAGGRRACGGVAQPRAAPRAPGLACVAALSPTERAQRCGAHAGLAQAAGQLLSCSGAAAAVHGAALPIRRHVFSRRSTRVPCAARCARALLPLRQPSARAREADGARCV